MIAKLLIANRGEIAVRIIRTARRMGISAVAVFSEADSHAPHVRLADEAVAIGPAEAARSYLDIEKIVGAARATGAEAVHPGYGFLSENADFARACLDAGLIFVGPSPEAIAAMGDKRAARRLMAKAGVPVVPGFDSEEADERRLAAAAARIGYPVLIKAAAGGGGRGMRIVSSPQEFSAALASARREALAAFGSDAVLLERLVADARHVEVQVFGDAHGNVVHLGERDCSAQRRHQKIVEESPSPVVNAALREKLGAWAVAAAKAVAYRGAGTVEFVVDQAGEAFFLEMNTRLQVEHPVTEMVTGLDLVEWQLRVATGEKLPLRQEEIRFSGHAIEARLCAENPYDGFRPQTGNILAFDPAAGDGLRIDSGVGAGSGITPFYDPMVAKLIAHGRDRAEAIDRLLWLLRRAPLVGVPGNGGFLARLVDSPVFREGAMTTGTIDRWIATDEPILAAPGPTETEFALAAAVAALAPGGDWFRSTGQAQCPVDLEAGGERRTVRLKFERGRPVGADTGLKKLGLDAVSWDGERLSATVDGQPGRHRVFIGEARYHLLRGAEILVFSEPDPLAGGPAKADPRRLATPVAGRVARIAVKAGDRVAAGDAIAMVEAMKLETVLSAAIAGVVGAVHVAEGQQVQAGDPVAEIEPGEAVS